MAQVIIDDTNLTAIANSIRGKNGTTNTYKPSDMPAAIAAIETCGSGGGSKGLTEITYNANGGTTLSPNQYLPIDVNEATSISFKYDYNNYSNSYANACDFRAYLGYGVKLKDGRYTYNQVDNTAKTQNILENNKTAVTGGTITFDVTNYTTVTFWIWFSDSTSSSAKGSLRIYDIEIK